MRKKFTFRKAFVLLLSLICVMAMSVTAFAAEVTKDEEKIDTKAVRAVEEDYFFLANNTDSTTVRLTRNVVANETEKDYTVVKVGNDCRVVVRMVNQSTGRSYLVTLTADGGFYLEKFGVSIPAGVYTVYFESAPCTVKQCWCYFIYSR